MQVNQNASDIYHNQLLNITPENSQQATTSVPQFTLEMMVL
jgi:hypothetical protein